MDYLERNWNTIMIENLQGIYLLAIASSMTHWSYYLSLSNCVTIKSKVTVMWKVKVKVMWKVKVTIRFCLNSVVRFKKQFWSVVVSLIMAGDWPCYYLSFLIFNRQNIWYLIENHLYHSFFQKKIVISRCIWIWYHKKFKISG